MSDDHAPVLDPDDLDISKSEYVREIGQNRYVVSAGGRPPRAPRSEASDEPAPAEPDQSDEPSTADASASAETTETLPRGEQPTESEPQGRSERSTEPDASRQPTSSDDADHPHEPPKRDATPRQGVKRGAPSRGGGAGTDSGEVDAAAVGRWLAESLSDTAFEYGFDATLSVDDETTRHRMVSNDVSTTFETLALWFARSAAGDDMPPERALGILLAEMDGEVTLPTAALQRAVARHGLSAEDSIGDLVAAAERENGLRLD